MDGEVNVQDMRWPIDALTNRLRAVGPSRQAELFLTIVDRLHDLVADLRPSADDLRCILAFLTDVGHAAGARRQEWVLLADVIGISTLIEDINADRPFGATPNTVAGPFYRTDAPEVALGANLSRDGKGQPLAVSGRIVDMQGVAVPGAMIEVWQANAAGLYENQEPDQQPEFNLRGKMRGLPDGRFHFGTVRPGGYGLPCDGPVGRMMGQLGLRLARPAHLHFRVTAKGFDTLTTHVFDRADPCIAQDAIFGVKPELLYDFKLVEHGPSEGACALEVRFVLCPADHATKTEHHEGGLL